MDKWVMSGLTSESIVPMVGLGATKYVGSDRYPYEVTRIGKGRSRARIWVRAMDWRCAADSPKTDMGCTEYDLFSDPDATEKEARWSQARKSWMVDGSPISFGRATVYRDPHF